MTSLIPSLLLVSERVSELRNQYLTRPEDLSRLDLLDTDIEMHLRDAPLLRRKVRVLKLALVALLTSVALFVAGIISR